MRVGKDKYYGTSRAGSDAVGDPSGFGTLPMAHAGIKALVYPARCAYCKHRTVFKNWREHKTHMTVIHPA